jgi:hypothetical protein
LKAWLLLFTRLKAHHIYTLKQRRSAVPQTLNNIMIGLTVSVAIIMILRYITNWYRFQLYLDEGNENTLRLLISEQNVWIIRHGVCVAGSLIMVAVIRYLSDVEDYERLAGSITIYAIMSSTFAFVESVMAQWLENRMAAIQASQHQVFDSE